MRTRSIAVLALVVVLSAMGLAACRDDSGGGGGGSTDPGSCDFNPPDEEFPSVDAPGVTDTEINVGALVASEGPLPVPFETIVDGTEAYFCKINQEGGVFGRELKVSSIRDDRGDFALTNEQARALVEEDQVFAVLPVATVGFSFGGANEYLGDAGIPTFGLNLTGWNDYPNLFGERGSFLCATCPIVAPAFVADQIEAERVAVLAYGVPQSADCAQGVREAFEHYDIEVAYFDDTVPYGFQPQDIVSTVTTIRDQDVDLLVTCMEVNGTTGLAEAMEQVGVGDIAVFASQGVDDEALDAFGSLLDDFYFTVPFWPFQLADENEGIAEYLEFMDARGDNVSEITFAGWSSAQLFVEGLLAAGPEFSQQAVIDAINEIDDWDAHGTRTVIDWTVEHTGVTDEGCGAYLKVEDATFVPIFGREGQPYVCFPAGLTTDDLAATLDDPVYKP